MRFLDQHPDTPPPTPDVLRPGSERASQPGGAWIAAEASDTGLRALVQVEQRGGRWVTTGLLLLGDEINSRTFRHLPLAAITSALNLDPAAAQALRDVQQSEDDVHLTDAIEAAYRRRKPVEQHPAAAPAVRPKLKRPDGSDPDGHCRQVAAAYREAVAAGKPPALAIAAEAGVPVGTARGWIQETRRRGHLPPGRRGRVG